MEAIKLAVLAATGLMLATTLSAQAQTRRATQPSQHPSPSITRQSITDQSITGRSIAPGTEQSVPEPRTLFTIGGVGVGVRAPVEPVYNARSNRNLAANPLWEAGQATDGTDF
jgi:hypothetical protein